MSPLDPASMPSDDQADLHSLAEPFERMTCSCHGVRLCMDIVGGVGCTRKDGHGGDHHNWSARVSWPRVPR